jgi:hypothetical protein
MHGAHSLSRRAAMEIRYFFFSSFFFLWSASPCTILAQGEQIDLVEAFPQIMQTCFFFGATDT